MAFSIPGQAKGMGVIVPVVVTVVCLLPFVGKAVHLDDPVFIWSAKQIHAKWFDFYGFEANWYGTDMPMSEMHHNPPGACYYMALVGLLLGWSEVALHIGFLAPAVAAAAGTYYLARELCSRPALAALAAVLTPGFLVSGTTLMCDMIVLALWVWATAFWVRGIKRDDGRLLGAAAVLISLCVLTRYAGVALVPLLFVYSLVERRKIGVWAVFLAIPLVILAAYFRAAYGLYGRALLPEAAGFALAFRSKSIGGVLSKGLTGLAFTGGCVITGLFYLPVLWSRRVLAGGLAAVTGFVAVVVLTGQTAILPAEGGGGVRWGLLVQVVAAAGAGAGILALAGADVRRWRSAESLLLMLWVVGIFVFATFVNWAVNARSILPLTPAAAILFMRRLDVVKKGKVRKGFWRSGWPLVPAAIVGLAVAWADYAWADSARRAAMQISERYGDEGRDVWFQGHWGFQYYMEGQGHRAVDFKRSRPARGDVIVIPSNNCFVRPLPAGEAEAVEVVRVGGRPRLATMNISLGAGFYSDIWGPAPFAAGRGGAEEYYIFIVKR